MKHVRASPGDIQGTPGETRMELTRRPLSGTPGRPDQCYPERGGVTLLWSWGAMTEFTGLAALIGGQEGEVGHAQDIRGKLA